MMEITSLPISELSSQIQNLVHSINQSEQIYKITDQSSPLAVLVSIQTYEKLTEQLENLNKVINPSKGSLPKAASLADNLKILQQSAQFINKLEDAYCELLYSAATTLENHESYFHGHNERVAIFACEIASQFGWSQEQIEHIRWAALLHDIGEIVIPAYILQKSSELTEEEWEIIKDHPRIGAEIVSKIHKLKPVAEIIYGHQEKYDGSGYPLRLKGDEIPLGSRILSVVDSYDAMTNLRLHREACSHQEAIAEIQRLKGTLYDPKIVDIFVNIF